MGIFIESSERYWQQANSLSVIKRLSFLISLLILPRILAVSTLERFTSCVCIGCRKIKTMLNHRGFRLMNSILCLAGERTQIQKLSRYESGYHLESYR